MRRVSTFSWGVSSAAASAVAAPEATTRAASATIAGAPAAPPGAPPAGPRARGRRRASGLRGIRFDGAQARLGAAPTLAQIGEHGEPGADDQHAAPDPDPGDQRIEIRLEGRLTL